MAGIFKRWRVVGTFGPTGERVTQYIIAPSGRAAEDEMERKGYYNPSATLAPAGGSSGGSRRSPRRPSSKGGTRRRKYYTRTYRRPRRSRSFWF